MTPKYIMLRERMGLNRMIRLPEMVNRNTVSIMDMANAIEELSEAVEVLENAVFEDEPMWPTKPMVVQ